jgi:hypothetical protein
MMFQVLTCETKKRLPKQLCFFLICRAAFKRYIQGCSKRSIHFQKFILQVLLNIWRRTICRLQGELSKLCSHLTITRCEPHVRRGRCQIDNPALLTLHVTPLGRQNYCVRTWHLVEIQIRTLRDFLSICTPDMGSASVVFVK